MIETCETSLIWLNETTYNCTVVENGLVCMKSNNKTKRSEDIKTFINVNLNLREEKQKRNKKLELYALKP